MISNNFLWLALAIAVLGNLAYTRDTFRGDTKPNRVTFFLWGAIPVISYFAQKSGGAGQQKIYTLVVGLVCFVILGASFMNKKAYWRITRFDLGCGILSLIALGWLLLANKPELALIPSMLADFTAALPTIIKSYKHPNTETPIAYASEVLSSLIVLLTLHHWTFVNYIFALYILLMNSLFTSLLLFSPNKVRRSLS